MTLVVYASSTVATGGTVCIITSIEARNCWPVGYHWDGLWHLPRNAPEPRPIPPSLIQTPVRAVRPHHFRHVRCQQRRNA